MASFPVPPVSALSKESWNREQACADLVLKVPGTKGPDCERGVLGALGTRGQGPRTASSGPKVELTLGGFLEEAPHSSCSGARSV